MEASKASEETTGLRRIWRTLILSPRLSMSWMMDKIKHTYVWMNDRYKGCKFEYQGWIK
jgi:hypothetical protein